jgi:hypothetical protein
MKLVLDLQPHDTNGRNSEGSFARTSSGRILFAYSRFNQTGGDDGGGCDIALVSSGDEGETWSKPRIIASAEAFGVRNIMSVSRVEQKDGRIGFYFLVKELDGSTSIARALSKGGGTFALSRCRFLHNKQAVGPVSPPASLKEPMGDGNYYVINNDRFIRLPDGRLAAPAGRHNIRRYQDGAISYDGHAVSVIFVSDDEGATFSLLPFRLTTSACRADDAGMQEPGLFVFKNGVVWIWARTTAGGQYESFSHDGLIAFTPPAPSIFTGPLSPLEVERNPVTGVIYAAYNPNRNYAGRGNDPFTWGRTPFVIRKSADEGRTWSTPVVVEDDPSRGYCYPAMAFTQDGALLLAYCRGGHASANCLCELGIMKLPLSEIP